MHIGFYPLLDGDRSGWLAADFDGPAAMLDALANLKAARSMRVPAALQVSRSGVGAHAGCSSPAQSRQRWHAAWAPACDPAPLPGKATAEIHDYHDTATGVLAASLA